MFRFLSALVLGAAMLAPVSLKADDDNRRERARRYYDREHRDYHEWNDSESQAYRRYLREQRREYRDFYRINHEQQLEYWRWRHLHPDAGR